MFRPVFPIRACNRCDSIMSARSVAVLSIAMHPNIDEVYTRFYTQTKAFSYEASTGTKRFEQLNLNSPYYYPSFWWENLWGSRELAVIGHGCG